MKYRRNERTGEDISALSFGFMRIGKEDECTGDLVRRAISEGINFFDTAYIYPGNEVHLGKILERDGLRGKVKICTKLPPYFVKKGISDAERIFNTSLERLRTNYADYYLIHMLGSLADWKRLIGLGIIDWISEKKASGKIRNIGFSYHGSSDGFIELLDAYDWDIAMIQYNYVDEHTQAGLKGLLHAEKLGVPIVIMEPLRGGTLANRLPAEAAKIFDRFPAKRSPAEWALRWLWNHSNILTVCSGMRNENELSANIRAANDSEPNMLTEDELKAYGDVLKAIRENTRVPCTFCGYCMPCPAGVDIPACFDQYNQAKGAGLYESLKSRAFYVIRNLHGNAGRCNGCGKCDPLCPQGISVMKEIGGVKKNMEGPFYRMIRFGVRKFMKRV